MSDPLQPLSASPSDPRVDADVTHTPPLRSSTARLGSLSDVDPRDDNHTSGAFRTPSTITLDPSDYPGWAVRMRSLLEYGDMWHLVAPLQQRADAATAAPTTASSSASSKGSALTLRASLKTREAHFILVSALRDAETSRLLIGLPPGDRRALWVALQRRFEHMPKAATAALYSELLTLRQVSGESARGFADRIALTRHQLANNGRPVSEDDAITVFVNGVHVALSQQVTSYYNLAPDPSFEQVVQVARGEETRLMLANKGSFKPQVANSAALALDPSSSSSSAAHVTCHSCNKVGHYASSCPERDGRRGAQASRLTATAEEIRAGACPRPGHKFHKAAKCRANSTSAAVASSSVATSSRSYLGDEEDMEWDRPAPRRVVHLGMVRVSKVVESEKVSASSATPSLSALSASERPAASSIVLDSGAGSTVIPSSAQLLRGEVAHDVEITVANGDVLATPLRGTAVLHAGALMLHVKNALQHAEIDRALLSVGGVLDDESQVSEVVFKKGAAAAITASGQVLFTASRVDGIYLLDTDERTSELNAKAFATRVAAVVAAAAVNTPLLVATLSPVQLWHQRFCHRSYEGIRLLLRAQAVRGLEGVEPPPAGAEVQHRCDGCAKGKAHRLPFSDRMDPSRAAAHILASVVSDVAGPLPVDSLGGARYFLVLLDDWSEFGAVILLAHKHEAADKIIAWCRQARARHNRDLVVFHSDGGGEFVNAKLANFFRQTGTSHTTTAAHTPQHNGKAERLIRTLMEWTNAALTHAGAAKKFWAHAVSTAMHVRNYTQVCKSAKASPAQGEAEAQQNRNRSARASPASASTTPFARWMTLSLPASVSHCRVFGCDADVLFTVSPGLKISKLEPKSRLCMFVGYDEDKNAWRFYDLAANRVFTSRDATFHEQQFTVSHAAREAERGAAEGGEIEDDMAWLSRTTFDNETRLMQIISREEADKAAAEARAAPSPAPAAGPGGDIDQDEGGDNQDPADLLSGDSSSSMSHASATAPPIDASDNNSTLRRSDRSRVAPNRYGMIGNNLAQARSIYVGLVDSAHEQSALAPSLYCLPRSYQEAMASPIWREAVARELAAHEANGTWKFVPLPTGRKAIGYKYVFKVKLNADGSVERAKVRLTAKGYSQREGVDYNETFAPVLCYHTLRAILAFVAAEDYEMHQIDVETAFLNAYVQEALFMQVPEGVVAPPGTVCQLVKALYGIKQAPHEWHASIAATLSQTLGYKASSHDPCLFTKRSRSGRLILFPVFVDDGFPACHRDDLAEMQEDKRELMAIYKIKDGGEASLLLGMRVTRDRVARTIQLDQEVYVDRLLSDYGASECKIAPTPEIVGAEDAEPEVESEAAAGDKSLRGLVATSDSNWRTAYGALVGSLQYAALATRPDIAHAVNSLARGLVAPTVAHRTAAHRVLRYLRGTSKLGLTFSGPRQRRDFIAYSDANWAGSGSSDGRSTTGWLMKYGSGPVSWSSKKQSIVALSSTESEFVAASTAAQEVLWLRALFADIGVPTAHLSTTTLFCDNRAAKALAESHKVSQRSKHINVRYHFIRDAVAKGEIAVEWISTEEQQADLFTKALGVQPFLRLRARVMGEQHD